MAESITITDNRPLRAGKAGRGWVKFIRVGSVVTAWGHLWWSDLLVKKRGTGDYFLATLDFRAILSLCQGRPANRLVVCKATLKGVVEIGNKQNS